MTDERPDAPAGDGTAIPPVAPPPPPVAPEATAETPPAYSAPVAQPPVAPPPAYVAPLPEAAPVAAAAVSYDPQPLDGGVDTSRNWFGIVALVFGIIGGSLIAIIFGALGVSAAKKGTATNRGMSITGIVLGLIWLIIGIIASIAFIIYLANHPVTTASADLVGKCYVSTVTSTDGLEEFDPSYGDCTAETNAEVYYVGIYTGLTPTDDPNFTNELYDLCTSDTALANVDRSLAADYWVEYYIANEDDWTGGNHAVTCGLSADGGTIDPGAILND